MPLQSTSGAASYDAFGGGAAAKVNYIEDFFQSYLRTGTGASATVTTGLDGSTKETLVWTKSRSAATNHKLTDNVRGVTKALSSNTTGAEATDSQGLTAFSATGYTIGTNTDYNNSGATYVDWQWVAQPKFFDVQTFTYPSSGSITVPHNLASTPGCVMVKVTDGADNWYVYHRMANNGTNPSNYILQLNTTSAQINNFASWITVGSTSITFPSGALNPGSNFVMYLFAHDAGGFGLTGTDNVISCGLTTANGSGDFSVNLGYEPQWVLLKSTGVSRWSLFDNMRGVTASSGYTSSKRLQPHLSDAEDQFDAPYGLGVNATGFTGNLATFSNDFIYIAIRRGPMKVPTDGTSVFSPSTYTGDDGSNREITGLSFTPDLMLNAMRLENGSGRSPSGFYWFDRLRGKGARLRSSQTLAEFLVGPAYEGVNFRSYSVDAASGESNYNPALYVSHLFKRAPSFFDEVCYTGVDSGDLTLNHNLSVPYEMLVIKRRSGVGNWFVLHSGLTDATKYIRLNTTNGQLNAGVTVKDSTNTTFLAPSGLDVTVSGSTYVAYLFATCAGVSKVGSYTGNGSSQTINCGFTGGARFVMVKATSTTGNWIVADSARGIVAGNDPATYINIATSELTSFDWIDADNSGFVVNETSTIAANTNGVTYIFLAIA
jgi:hypothetical protein